MQELVLTPSDFVAVLNQTLEYAYPLVTIEGELANVRVSRGRWVYFDIKDETASVKCFGTVYVLPGPIEEGMMVRIVARPQLHPVYNFSLNLQSVIAVGEGSLKRAADLLAAKLETEGLFDSARKRLLPFAPTRVGFITSQESAAYHDFIKILNERWGGIHIVHGDVQVQGEQAVIDIVKAIEAINQLANPPEVIVLTRGGGSADDLAAFSSEQVVRAVATSRIPTLVAIGHEIDISLAELAADQRASTPSNAAEILVPDKKQIAKSLREQQRTLRELTVNRLQAAEQEMKENKRAFVTWLDRTFFVATQTLARQIGLLEVLNPEAALRRGYAVVHSLNSNAFIKSAKTLHVNDSVNITWHDGSAEATIKKVQY